MAYRDILVQIDETAASRARAVAAAATASRAKASLTGVFLKADFIKTLAAASLFTDSPPFDVTDILKQHADAVDRAGEQARETFEQAAAQAGVASSWLVIEGDDSKALIAQGRRHDLTMLPAHAKVTLGDHRVGAAAIAMQIGGPVMVVPDTGLSPKSGERVLLAWNGSREAARALRDAWPMIDQARQLIVLIVSPKGEDGPDSLLQRHLEAHGCRAEVIVDRSEDAVAGEVLRRQVKTLDVGMVVMGLYGRPRLEELILGGVSREMTAEPPCALFLSH